VTYHVYLRVTPLKEMKHFHVKGKLAPRYIRPFKITSRRGEVAYQLNLPLELADVQFPPPIPTLGVSQAPVKPDLHNADKLLTSTLI
jgi:hypothetical protein